MLACYLDGVLNNNTTSDLYPRIILTKIQIIYDLTDRGVISSWTRYRSHAELDRDCNLVQLDIVSYRIYLCLRVIERSTDRDLKFISRSVGHFFTRIFYDIIFFSRSLKCFLYRHSLIFNISVGYRAEISHWDGKISILDRLKILAYQNRRLLISRILGRANISYRVIGI